jgi:hypothetical protein
MRGTILNVMAALSCGYSTDVFDRGIVFKILDSVRMKSALMLFPYYVRTGGWVALAGKLSSPFPPKRQEKKNRTAARF